ncbi:bifunctional hydroxymethylpyrimidine kinase/phosphomethylpyrimidine kinase [Curvibacter sp. CHRR-16]|uniref:bifunctional hydroxymethylpyrimidine kinase/phosphomethylpyrimidine kinase n=1 Tax=Curvibacter sp. CHRR-16 TaxID=2835872 RepID=UPI001BDA4BB5|nr:bifunctional hydroxymethylpyrimidine kinase/phosphomethylpyrimidine kinase [Curvibacter sp. CHRR-16]MBT0568874.1 bifunctional hydroxymethylpyrimidine kinase/phosphomethylpyrimidine kinase [Curvibacter sp. CHRR-16]
MHQALQADLTLKPHLPHTPKPIIWVIAGHDSGGGAGLSADQRAAAALGVHACPVVAAITAQNSVAVQRIEASSPALLEAQLQALAQDMPPAAIKTGMLADPALVRVVARWVDRLREQAPHLPLVVDPVLRASTGAALCSANAADALIHALRTELLPRATLITPNQAEATALLGSQAHGTDTTSVEQQAQALAATGCSVVITGGDAVDGAGQSTHARDYLLCREASGWLSLPRVDTPHHHGTGCTFASAAASALALGYPVADAVVLAKMLTTHALRHSYAAGAGAGPLLPRADFARLENLPTLSLPWQNSLSSAVPTMAPLTGAQRTLGLYAIVDSADWVERVLAAGVRTVQLRMKTSAPEDLPTLRSHIQRSVQAVNKHNATQAAGAQLYINDHWQLALEAGAFGVHLGQEDLLALPDSAWAAMAAAGLRVGISTHSLWEVCRAWTLQPSYIACGPIHATQSKDMPWLPQGNGNLAFWSQLLPVPVVGIAGMDAPRLQEAVRHGAAGVALISAITAAPEPEAAIAELQAAWEQGLRLRELQATPSPLLPRSTLQHR